jgi:mono/diheme cytochrome c family protein
MRIPAFAISLTIILGGCAMMEENPAASSVMPSAIRGMEVAELRCSGCHSIGGLAVSPRPNAPTFQQLRLRYNQITWERAMAEIAEGGHDEMPAVRLETADIHDLQDYIRTLRPTP